VQDIYKNEFYQGRNGLGCHSIYCCEYVLAIWLSNW